MTMLRRSTLALACALLAAACGGDGGSGPSGQAYTVTHVASQAPTRENGNYVRVVSLRVTDAAAQPVMGATVRSRATGGAITPQPLVTNASGEAHATWTIPSEAQTAGTTHSLAFCARSEGTCEPNTNADDAVRVTF